MDRLKKFFLNGIILTLVALASRYVSVAFNIYVSNKIGSVAMGLFTLVSSVYGFALTLATSGINLATTKLVSEALGIGEADKSFHTSQALSAIMKKSLLFALGVSASTSLLLFAASSFIGTRLLGDARTVSSLRVLACSLVPIAISSSLSGYFSAVREAYKNAAVQVIAQASRIILCVFFLTRLFASDMESSCLAIVCATTLSEVLSLLAEWMLFVHRKRRTREITDKSSAGACRGLPSKLISITLPVALSAYVRSALVTVEHLLIPWGLERSGSSRERSLASYGTLHSLVFPLVLFPSAISSAFAGLLVPEISESNAAGDGARIERIVSRVLKTVLIYSVGCAGVMICLSGELGRVLIGSADSSRFLLMIAPLVPVMYLDTSVDCILKGLGYQFYTMIINIVDASLSLVLVVLLLPRFGILGYVATVYFTELVNATLSVTKLLLVTKVRVRIFDWVAKPLLSAIASTAVARFILSRLGSYAVSKAELSLHVILISVLYLGFLVLTRAISLGKLKNSIKGFIKA